MRGSYRPTAPIKPSRSTDRGLGVVLCLLVILLYLIVM